MTKTVTTCSLDSFHDLPNPVSAVCGMIVSRADMLAVRPDCGDWPIMPAIYLPGSFNHQSGSTCEHGVDHGLGNMMAEPLSPHLHVHILSGRRP